jgi:hypothetical protein
MDAESCACGAGKGKKCSCDGGCGSYKKMDAALTPHEYLAACELSIQDRSRQYIRARLDAAERLDLKCGNGSISQGEKCTKGAAGSVQKKPNSQGGSKVRGLKTAAKIAGAAALIGGAAYMQQTAYRRSMQQGAMAAPGSRSNTFFKNQVVKLGGNNETAQKMRRRAFEENIIQSRMKNTRKSNSVWAEGFQP